MRSGVYLVKLNLWDFFFVGFFFFTKQLIHVEYSNAGLSRLYIVGGFYVGCTVRKRLFFLKLSTDFIFF